MLGGFDMHVSPFFSSWTMMLGGFDMVKPTSFGWETLF